MALLMAVISVYDSCIVNPADMKFRKLLVDPFNEKSVNGVAN